MIGSGRQGASVSLGGLGAFINLGKLAALVGLGTAIMTNCSSSMGTPFNLDKPSIHDFGTTGTLDDFGATSTLVGPNTFSEY